MDQETVLRQQRSQLAQALSRIQEYLVALGYSAELIDPDGTVQDIISDALLDMDVPHAQQLAREEDHRRWLHKMMDQERKGLHARLEHLMRELQQR